MRYVGNPKHKEPWQPGRRGSLCPKEVWPYAQRLLDNSILHGKQRYAIFNGIPYAGKSDKTGTVWHGHPVGISKVPAEVVKIWSEAGIITNRMIKSLRRS